LLLPCAATGVSLLAVWCLSGATPRGQPWTPAVTLPQGCDGLSARRRALLSTFRAPSLGRQGHRAFMRSALLDVPLIILATACRQRNDVERYSRFMICAGNDTRRARGRHLCHVRRLPCRHASHPCSGELFSPAMIKAYKGKYYIPSNVVVAGFRPWVVISM
jgi:hypothetical protein